MLRCYLAASKVPSETVPNLLPGLRWALPLLPWPAAAPCCPGLHCCPGLAAAPCCPGLPLLPSPALLPWPGLPCCPRLHCCPGLHCCSLLPWPVPPVSWPALLMACPAVLALLLLPATLACSAALACPADLACPAALACPGSPRPDLPWCPSLPCWPGPCSALPCSPAPLPCLPCCPTCALLLKYVLRAPRQLPLPTCVFRTPRQLTDSAVRISHCTPCRWISTGAR